MERVTELPRVSGLALPSQVLEAVRPAGESAICRAIQVALCLVAVALLSPVMLAVALAARCTSRGPVFYRGKRVGKHERVFDILKFRTLVVDAEQRIGARLLKEEDQVYTPIGKFLKKWKLDDLPQLLNVIKGDMSLVGPRPVRPIFLEAFKREIANYGLRFQVRPGATGLAQLRGGYWTEPQNKLRYELVYIRNQSLWFDLWLMDPGVFNGVACDVAVFLDSERFHIDASLHLIRYAIIIIGNADLFLGYEFINQATVVLGHHFLQARPGYLAESKLVPFVASLGAVVYDHRFEIISSRCDSYCSIGCLISVPSSVTSVRDRHFHE